MLEKSAKLRLFKCHVTSGLRREENCAVLGIRTNGEKRNIYRDLVEKTEGNGH